MEGIKECHHFGGGGGGTWGKWLLEGGKRERAASVTPSFGEKPWLCSMPYVVV